MDLQYWAFVVLCGLAGTSVVAGIGDLYLNGRYNAGRLLFFFSAAGFSYLIGSAIYGLDYVYVLWIPATAIFMLIGLGIQHEDNRLRHEDQNENVTPSRLP